MTDEKPISLEELQDRVKTEGEPQLEDGILNDAPHDWFENIQHYVDTAHVPTPSKPDGPAH